MKIRLGKYEDLKSIVNIYNQAISSGNATADLKELSVNDRIDWFNDHNENEYPIYVIESDDKIIGWGSLSPYRKGRGALRETAEISYYIDYNYHGLGYGKKIIEYMINDCKRIGIKNLFAMLLEVNQKSIKLLEQFGFSKWGHLPNIVNLNGTVCGHVIYGRNLSEML